MKGVNDKGQSGDGIISSCGKVVDFTNTNEGFFSFVINIDSIKEPERSKLLKQKLERSRLEKSIPINDRDISPAKALLLEKMAAYERAKNIDNIIDSSAKEDKPPVMGPPKDNSYSEQVKNVKEEKQRMLRNRRESLTVSGQALAVLIVIGILYSFSPELGMMAGYFFGIVTAGLFVVFTFNYVSSITKEEWTGFYYFCFFILVIVVSILYLTS